MISSAPEALGAASDTKASGHLLAFNTFPQQPRHRMVYVSHWKISHAA